MCNNSHLFSGTVTIKDISNKCMGHDNDSQTNVLYVNKKKTIWNADIPPHYVYEYEKINRTLYGRIGLLNCSTSFYLTRVVDAYTQ